MRDATMQLSKDIDTSSLSFCTFYSVKCNINICTRGVKVPWHFFDSNGLTSRELIFQVPKVTYTLFIYKVRGHDSTRNRKGIEEDEDGHEKSGKNG